MRIYLCGFMGAGKTRVGKKLSKKLDYSFIDLDHYIEEKENLSVAEIFDRYGEEYFRKLEANSLRELNDENNYIISTGGGTPCYYDNMEFMNENGLTVYIRMSVEGLYERLKKAKKDRPLIAGLSREELCNYIRSKLNDRKSFYEKARFIIEGKDLQASELLKLIERDIQ